MKYLPAMLLLLLTLFSCNNDEANRNEKIKMALEEYLMDNMDSVRLKKIDKLELIAVDSVTEKMFYADRLLFPKFFTEKTEELAISTRESYQYHLREAEEYRRSGMTSRVETVLEFAKDDSIFLKDIEADLKENREQLDSVQVLLDKAGNGFFGYLVNAKITYQSVSGTATEGKKIWVDKNYKPIGFWLPFLYMQ
jgi:hypothetical protein